MLTAKVTYRSWSDDLEDFVHQATELDFHGRTIRQVLRQTVSLYGVRNIQEVRISRQGVHIKTFGKIDLIRLLEISMPPIRFTS